MENCSKREVKEILATHFPNKIKPKESLRFTSSEEAALHVNLSKDTLKKLDQIKSLRAHKNPRYISAQLKQRIFKRDNYQCTYTHLQTKHRCESKHLLQIDHRVPISKGGKTTEENLRLLCQQHHRYVDQWV